MLAFIISLVAVGGAGWWFLLKMPGKNISSMAALSSAEIKLRDELIADVRMLGGEIGERNMARYPQLNSAADFIENSFSSAGLHPRRDSYELQGQACHNIEAEIRGTFPQIILIGAHYDSVFGSPGANDNGSGVAAMLALARRSIAFFRKHAGVPSEGAALPSFIPGVSWSDQWAFWRHGYPGIMITDTAPFRYPHYHSATDTPDKLDYDRFALVVSGVQKVIEELDRAPR